MIDEADFDFLRDSYERPYHRGRLESATHVMEEANFACGDEVRLELRIEDDVVREAWFSGRGCIVSQVSASALTQYLEGKEIASLRGFREQEQLALIGVRLTHSRRRCALLAWRALQALLSQIPQTGPP